VGCPVGNKYRILKLVDRSSQSPGQAHPTSKKHVSVALTQEGERNHASLSTPAGNEWMSFERWPVSRSVSKKAPEET
jgi:hypothetical protein